MGERRYAALGTPCRDLWERCEAVSAEGMPCLQLKMCACPWHLAPTGSKTGEELGEHLCERGGMRLQYESPPPVGEGGDRWLNRHLRGEEDLEEGAQLQGQT